MSIDCSTTTTTSITTGVSTGGSYISTGDYTTGTYITGGGNTLSYTGYIPTNVISRKDLKEFCNNNILTKEKYEELEDLIPMGTNLLIELVKIKIDLNYHSYVKLLLRQEKLKRIRKL
jgi:hypothetical protein